MWNAVHPLLEFRVNFEDSIFLAHKEFHRVLLVLVKDISSSLLIASLELSVLGAVDLLRNEFEVTGDGLCVYQLCWN